MIKGTGEYQAIGEAAQNSSTWVGLKPWAEITADEKIERLRQEMDGWRRECARLRDRLNLLENHRHGINNEIVVELKQVDRLSAQGACASFNTLA